jgi:hypothetical protein
MPKEKRRGHREIRKACQWAEDKPIEPKTLQTYTLTALSIAAGLQFDFETLRIVSGDISIERNLAPSP